MQPTIYAKPRVEHANQNLGNFYRTKEYPDPKSPRLPYDDYKPATLPFTEADIPVDQQLKKNLERYDRVDHMSNNHINSVEKGIRLKKAL